MRTDRSISDAECVRTCVECAAHNAEPEGKRVLDIAVAVILITATAITGYIANRRRKRQMEASLGRPVDDAEMTSINTWMEVEKKNKPEAIIFSDPVGPQYTIVDLTNPRCATL